MHEALSILGSLMVTVHECENGEPLNGTPFSPVAEMYKGLVKIYYPHLQVNQKDRLQSIGMIQELREFLQNRIQTRSLALPEG